MLPTSVIILLVLCIVSMIVFTVTMIVKETHLESLWKDHGDNEENYSRRCANNRNLRFLERLEMVSGIIFVGSVILVIVSLSRLVIFYGV